MSQQQQTSILNNKFEYFNNKPSQYYEIKYHYYPSSEESKIIQSESPYATNGTSHNKTQLLIEVATKPRYLRFVKFAYLLSKYLS